MATLFSPTGPFLVLMKTQSPVNTPWLLMLSGLVLAPVFHFFYEKALVTRSNRTWSYPMRSYLLWAICLALIVLSFFSKAVAIFVLGILGLLVLFFVISIIVIMFSKKSWH